MFFGGLFYSEPEGDLHRDCPCFVPSGLSFNSFCTRGFLLPASLPLSSVPYSGCDSGGDLAERADVNWDGCASDPTKFIIVDDDSACSWHLHQPLKLTLINTSSDWIFTATLEVEIPIFFSILHMSKQRLRKVKKIVQDQTFIWVNIRFFWAPTRHNIICWAYKKE